MIPSLPDLSVPAGPIRSEIAAPGAFGPPGATLRGGPNTPGAGLDFAGLLNAALPEGEIAAPTLTKLPATVPDIAPEPRGAPFVPVPLTVTATSAPSAPAPQPILLRELPQAHATHLPTGTLLPESGGLVPQPGVSPQLSVTALSNDVPAETPIIAPEIKPDPVNPEAAAPLIAVQLRADTSSAPQDQSEPISLTEGEEADQALLAPSEPVPVAAPIVLASTISATTPARAAIRTDEPRAGPTLRAERAPLPARIALPETEGDTATTPTPAAMLAEMPSSAAANNAQQPAPTTAPLALTPAATPAMAERAEPRALAPQQESAIAVVGEIREALRAARPEMTLRHAEFGFVSLRIEPTGMQDWRAVLASRDPGFVPAIQAALADRAVAAAAETASTGTGQNGTGDQRYGSSPNGGQGSSQPYLAQSSSRDEGGQQHPNQHQPRSAAEVATRAGEADAERADPRGHGVFA